MKKREIVFKFFPLILFFALLSLSLRAGHLWYDMRQKAEAQSNAVSIPIEIKSPQNLTENEILVLQQLSIRRTALDERQKQLEALQKKLDEQQRLIDQKMKELKSLERKAEEQNLQLPEDEIGKLSKIYANMKAEQSAHLLAAEQTETAVEILKRMSNFKAAQILEKMSPEKALILTQKIGKKASS